MVQVRLSQVHRAATLLKQGIERSDLNMDGALRSSDISKVSSALPDKDKPFASGLMAASFRANHSGSHSLAVTKKSVDELEKLLGKADQDKNGKLDEAEIKTLKTQGERRFLDFVIWSKGKKLSSLSLPPQHPPHKPKFNYAGTPAEVCQSLLDAVSSRGNDNFWPWGDPSPSRYVINGTEAKAMVATLKKLYPARQKSVLTVLASRTHESGFGCVSPNAAGTKILQAYAQSLGLSLEFMQPAAPKMPGL
ncbi:MAG: hypothetical protein U1E65_02565 [Myxococcota bacterium]